MLRILFAARPQDWEDYRAVLPQALSRARLDADLTREAAPEAVDYIVTVPGGLADFTPFTRCRLVQSLWAGVERFMDNATLTQPLARMVDPGLAAGMVDYVTGHVLRLHLEMDAHILGQDGVWRNAAVPPLAREREVGVLGLGELGGACATALAGLGFRVAGWSRSPRNWPGVTCLHGDDGLRAVLGQAQILVALLPATAETENLLNAERLSWLPRGAMIVNPGRGSLIDDGALLAALDSGQVGQATLDVFRREPLPPAHPYWAHPRVTVTPHIAAATRPATAAEVVADNIRRVEAGEPPRHLVDRARGY